MQRAADRILDDKPIGKCTVVMRAGSSDCKVILPAAHQNRVFAVDAALDDGAVGNLLNGNAGPKIQLIGLFHACFPVRLLPGDGVGALSINRRCDGEFESIARNLQFQCCTPDSHFSMNTGD